MKTLKRSQRRVAKTRPAADVPPALHEAIECERARLAQAASVLGCLIISMEHAPEEPATGPYYPDVAQLAHDMVKNALNGLDSLTLQQALLRDKVKDEFYLPAAPGADPGVELAVAGWSSAATEQKQSVAVNRFNPVLHRSEARLLQ